MLNATISSAWLILSRAWRHAVFVCLHCLSGGLMIVAARGSRCCVSSCWGILACIRAT